MPCFVAFAMNVGLESFRHSVGGNRRLIFLPAAVNENRSLTRERIVR